MPKPRPRIARAPIQRSAVREDDRRARLAPDHLRMVRALPCVVTGRLDGVEAHHLCEGMDGRGMGRRAEDRWTIPLHRDAHAAAHATGIPETWLMEAHGVDARALAEALWRHRGDAAGMLRAVERERQAARLRLMGSASMGGIRPAADRPGDPDADDAGRDHGADAA